MYGLIGDSGKYKREGTYICGTRRRFRVGACDEPIYNRKKFDDELALQVKLYLADKPDFVSEKLQEALSGNRTAELQAEVDRRQMIISDIEKRLNRLRKRAEETDDEGITARINELLTERQQANNAVFTARSKLDEQPNFDPEQMTPDYHRGI